MKENFLKYPQALPVSVGQNHGFDAETMVS